MANPVRLKAEDGSDVEFVDEVIGSGAMKDVYFSPDRSYVVGFFRSALDFKSMERLENITGSYRERIFNQEGGDYWKKLFCWPTKIVRWPADGGERVGVVCPTYDPDFFFSSGKFKGKEKEGKWFASAKLRNKFIEADQKGNWLSYFHICIQIARAVSRLHKAGLSHSDLSYKNILLDPLKGRACIIDCDGLVVPGKFPPDVVGTPDFIAPEVMETKSLAKDDPARKLPCIATDRHALAVLIYMYLLYRHPLKGRKVWDTEDTARDEELSMGKNAVFIEDPNNPINRPNVDDLAPAELPDGDISRRPYTMCGPYLKKLFDRAFTVGLHDPSKRPSADEWVDALVRTTDLMQPCSNPHCSAHWYVFDNTTRPVCPFCGQAYNKPLPVLNMYFRHSSNDPFRPDGSRLMVYDNQSLYLWHVNYFVSPSERLSPEQKRPVGDFHFFNGQWILINRSLDDMWDKSDNKKIEKNQSVALTDGRKILFSSADGGRLTVVQVANI